MERKGGARGSETRTRGRGERTGPQLPSARASPRERGGARGADEPLLDERLDDLRAELDAAVAGGRRDDDAVERRFVRRGFAELLLEQREQFGRRDVSVADARRVEQDERRAQSSSRTR